MKHTAQAIFITLILTTVLSVLLIGCDDTTVEPIIYYVTATSDAQIVALSDSAAIPADEVSADITEVGQAPTSSATPVPGATDTPLPPFPSSTPSATSPYSPTPRPPTLTPTPSPSPTSPIIAPTFDVPAPELLPQLVSAQMGIQIHPFIEGEEWKEMLAHAKLLGVDWIKVQLPWREMEPRPGEYSELFKRYATQMQHSGVQVGKKFKVLISVVNAPDWARPEGFDPNLHGPPTDPQALANFLKRFLEETVPADHTIDAIEIWNEPNLEREWNGMPMDGGTYMQYFHAAYDAIKSVAPDVIVVTAGLAPVGSGLPGAVSDREFLQQMYNAGLADYADVKIGIHPYGWGNPPDEMCCNTERGWADNPVFFFQETLNDYIEIMQRNNHSTKLWVTEFGWGTYKAILPDGSDAAPPPSAEFFNLITPRQQAEYLLRALSLMQQQPLNEFVEMAFIWNLNFAMVSGDLTQTPTEQAGYGLLNAAGQQRLSYWYLVQAPKVITEEE